jgi:HK97 family phage portal protein
MFNLKAIVKGMFGMTPHGTMPDFAMQIDPWQGWQRGLDRSTPYVDLEHTAPIAATTNLISRSVSQCEGKHMTRDGNDGFVQNITSPAARILRKPNNYETWALFITNVTKDILNGESLVVIIRDNRFAPASLHRIPKGMWSPYVDHETGAIFYAVSKSDVTGNIFQDAQMLIPARDCIHFRQSCPRHPLVGESLLVAAALAAGIHVGLSRSQLAFFNNMNRPSGVLTTDMTLNKVQIRELREAFNEQSRMWEQGGVPILASGLKFQPVNVSQADSQLIEQQKLSATEIYNIYGVPAGLMSDGSTGTKGATEALISHFLSVGLGSMLECIEQFLERAFDFGPNDKIELDPTPLLRVDFEGRINGLVKAVQGGLLTPFEARSKEGYGHVAGEGDDQLYMQRQMTPVNQLQALNEADLAAKLAPAPEPAAPPPEPAAKADPEMISLMVRDTIKGICDQPVVENTNPELLKQIVRDTINKSLH